MKPQNQMRGCCSKYEELIEIQNQNNQQNQLTQQTLPNTTVQPPQNETKQIDQTQQYLGSYDEAPQYMRDNQFIRTGYRINFNTYKKSLKSCFMFSNNEFSNIWSHFIGILIALALIITVSSFIAKNDHGIIQKTIHQLDIIYEKYQEEIELQNKINHVSDNTIVMNPELTQQFNSKFTSILNRINQNDNYIHQIESFERILDDVIDLSKTYPIQYEQNLQINQIYLNLKSKITEELQSDNLDWVDVYKIFGINRLDNSDDNNRRVTDPKQISKWPIFFYLLSSITCFSGSVLFHTFNSVSAKHWDFLLRVDYAGICFIIAGGCVPIIYYGFYCDAGVLYFYLTLITIFCLFVFVISLFDFVHSEKYRSFKGFLYGTLGLAAAIPLAHLLFRAQYINGIEETDYLSLSSSFPFYLLTGLSLFTGLGIYLARCPERFSPGKFDKIGNSHNIWHACVVIGVIFGYIGALENFYARKQTFCFLK